MKILSVLSLLYGIALAVAVATPVATIAATPQQTFATPEAAADALMTALKADNDAPLTALFGEEHKVKLFDPDPAAAQANRARIVESMQTLRVRRRPARLCLARS